MPRLEDLEGLREPLVEASPDPSGSGAAEEGGVVLPPVPEESDAAEALGTRFSLRRNLRRLKSATAWSAASRFDLFLRVPLREQGYCAQFRYVWQWKLWSAEALDVFFLDRVVGPSQPWPWWLRYNPFWLLAHYMLVLCFSSGCLLHCLLYQGYPVTDESPEERRFRIHYIYGFDAYLGGCGWLFLASVFLVHDDDKRYMAVEGVVLSLLWILGNFLGLQAMYAQSSTGIRCFVAGQLAWTVVLTAINIFELVANFSTLSLYHLAVVGIFWIGVFFYFLPLGPTEGLWYLYTDTRSLSNVCHWTVIVLTVRTLGQSPLLHQSRIRLTLPRPTFAGHGCHILQLGSAVPRRRRSVVHDFRHRW